MLEWCLHIRVGPDVPSVLRVTGPVVLVDAVWVHRVVNVVVVRNARLPGPEQLQVFLDLLRGKYVSNHCIPLLCEVSV